ncbi:MAG: glycosyltransferase family 4 protein [Candidatus Paceibacteria bacterium]
MNKKILFIVNVDWFFISHRLPLAIEALTKGYEVHIACGISDKKEHLENLGLKVHPLNISRSGTGIKDELKAFVEIYKILKKIAPDIAHFVTIKPVLYGGIASRFLGSFRKVFAISGLGFVFVAQTLKAKIVRTIVKSMYKIALGGKNSHVIVQNPEDKKVILSFNVTDNENITLIKGSGVDLEQYTYKISENNVPKIVMASRLLKEKGVFEFVTAAEILENKNLKVEFELYGEIDEGNPNSLTKNDLDRISKISNLKIKGFSNNIKSVFQESDIVVLPSYYGEGLPKVLIEAAACGRAIITTNMPGCQDTIIENKTGLFCEVKNSKSLAEQIEKLILNNELRNDMGKAGRELAEKEFDINKVVDKHFEIYEGKS